MYSQTFFILNSFLYDTCFDDWKEQNLGEVWIML
jgi:hypothetical protein